MKRTLALLTIGLIFGGGIGFLTATANSVALPGHSHDVPDGHGAEVPMKMDMKNMNMAHSHSAGLAIPNDENAPTLEIAVIKDLMSGWNLHVMPANFRFAPEHASQPHVAGEGHAHVYVNGTKIARLYGPWMHLTDLPKGNANIEVVLNSNDHRPLSVEGTPVSATRSITVN
ncbi:MAG: hypothetical protein COC12_11005 [Rhodobacteraceae bacterium]|nr:MAG: hypothetical protein COC12_11005 [Paracoccaceae bacterium]